MAHTPIYDRISDINGAEGLIGLGPLPGQAPVASFNLAQVQNLIDTKGIEAYHYRFAYSPQRESLAAGVNVNTVQANQYGVLFYEIRKLKVVPYSLSFRDSMQLDGTYGQGSAVLNVSGQYADGLLERAMITTRDLIVLNHTITTQHKQLVEFNPNGDTRVKYKIRHVEYLASSSQRFEEGVDFCVTTEGTIRWQTKGNKPSPKEILSIVFWFSPVYVVSNVPHSLRLLPSNDTGDGRLPRELKYAPQQIVCVQSHLSSEIDLDFSSLPIYNDYADSKNTTGGSI